MSSIETRVSKSRVSKSRVSKLDYRNVEYRKSSIEMSSIEMSSIEMSSIEKLKFESRESIKSAMLHTSLMSFLQNKFSQILEGGGGSSWSIIGKSPFVRISSWFSPQIASCDHKKRQIYIGHRNMTSLDCAQTRLCFSNASSNCLYDRKKFTLAAFVGLFSSVCVLLKLPHEKRQSYIDHTSLTFFHCAVFKYFFKVLVQEKTKFHLLHLYDSAVCVLL